MAITIIPLFVDLDKLGLERPHPLWKEAGIHDRATVKAGTQECGTECRTEVMWFHTGNYTETMQEVTIDSSFPSSYSCNSTAIFHRPSSLSLKNI